MSSLLMFGVHFAIKTIRALSVMLSQVLNLERKFLKRKASVSFVSSTEGHLALNCQAHMKCLKSVHTGRYTGHIILILPTQG